MIELESIAYDISPGGCCSRIWGCVSSVGLENENSVRERKGGHCRIVLAFLGSPAAQTV